MNTSKAHRIALLFNANKSFDREIISGIAAYLGSTRAAWDLFLEEDFRLRLAGIEDWQETASLPTSTIQAWLPR